MTRRATAGAFAFSLVVCWRRCAVGSATQPDFRVYAAVDPLTCSLAMLISGALGAPAHTHALPVTVQDDALMLHRAPGQVEATARRMAELGADRVRLTAS